MPPLWLVLPPGASHIRARVCRSASHALLKEMRLTPKPGLVDLHHSGAHRDMDIETFRRSLRAIRPWFPVFFDLGWTHSDASPADCLPFLRQCGLQCEADMFRATQGVNTHKGSIFAFALLCGAAGRLCSKEAEIKVASLCAEVSAICAEMVRREFQEAREKTHKSAGERLYVEHGLTGARGEAQSGFATARAFGLSVYLRARELGMTENSALFEALLSLMAHNQDTNLVSRGHLIGLQFVQNWAQKLLFTQDKDRAIQLLEFDGELIKRNLSPGGSADLLAVSRFLADFSA